MCEKTFGILPQTIKFGSFTLYPLLLLKLFEEAIELTEPEVKRPIFFNPHPLRPPLADLLSGIEKGYDDPEKFRDYCRHFREKHPEFVNIPLVQWYLEPIELIADWGMQIAELKKKITDLDELISEIQNPNSEIPDPKWKWHDPYGDSSFTAENGFEIHAANGRDLWHLNQGAPRVLRDISGDFAVQIVCVPVDPSPRRGGEQTPPNLSEGKTPSSNQKEEQTPPSLLGKGVGGLGQKRSISALSPRSLFFVRWAQVANVCSPRCSRPIRFCENVLLGLNRLVRNFSASAR